MLDIDIVWVLSAIAIIFFTIRWLLDRKIAQKQILIPNLSPSPANSLIPREMVTIWRKLQV